MNTQTITTAKAEEARRRTLNNELGDVCDRLCEANDLCEAVFMAAGYLQREETGAVQTVVLEAQNRIKAASEALYAIRESAR